MLLYYTILCFIFVVKISSLASQWTKIIYSNILLHRKLFTTNIQQQKFYGINYWVYLHMFRSVCRWCFPVATIFLLQTWGYVCFTPFQSMGCTSRCKGTSIAKCIICYYSFCPSGSAESDRSQALTYWLPLISVCQFLRKVSKRGGPDCKKLVSC